MKLSRPALVLLGVIYLGFISLGLPDGTLGVAWPAVHRDLSLPVGLAGALALVGTLLAAISGFSSGWVLRRWRTGPVVAVSCLLTGSGLALLSLSSGAVLLFVATIPLGFGAGAVDAGLNGYVARHYSGRHMNWLHACWGIGATLGPLLMASMLARKGEEGWRLGYGMLAGIQLTLAVGFLATLRLWDKATTHAPEDSPSGAAKLTAPTLGANSEAGWLSALVFALYVATETTLGVWASTVLVDTRGFDLATAGYCATGYYASITAGRILVGFLVDSWGNRLLIRCGLTLALAGLVVFFLASAPWQAALSLIIVGLGFAPVYPGLMHEVPSRFSPEAVFVVIGRQSGASYIGGALVPALVGWLANRNSPAVVLPVVLSAAVLLLVAILRLDRLTPVRN